MYTVKEGRCKVRCRIQGCKTERSRDGLCVLHLRARYAEVWGAKVYVPMGNTGKVMRELMEGACHESAY